MISRNILILLLVVSLAFTTVIAEHHEQGEMHEMEMGVLA